MKTSHPEFFAALAAPIPDHLVKTKPGKGGQGQRYITARTVMNRLDSVVGPENWEPEYFELCKTIFCRLWLVLPDGRRVSKTDAGGFATMLANRQTGEIDEKSSKKSGASDALKRAAAVWGIGRELYRDGVADFVGERPPGEAPRREPRRAEPAPDRQPPPAANGNWSSFPRSWDEALKRSVKRWFEIDPPIPALEPEAEATAREHRIAHHLVTVAIGDGRVAEAKVSKVNPKGETVRDPREVWACVKWLWYQDPTRVYGDLKAYLAGKAAEAAAKAAEASRPAPSPDEPEPVPEGRTEPSAGDRLRLFESWVSRQSEMRKCPADSILGLAVSWGARQGFFDDPFYMKGDSFVLPDAEAKRLAAIAHARDAKGLTREIGSALRFTPPAEAEAGNDG